MDIRGYDKSTGSQKWIPVQIWGRGQIRIFIHRAGDKGLSPTPLTSLLLPESLGHCGTKSLWGGKAIIPVSNSSSRGNEIQVVLIPNVNRLEEVGQFRPISCCNFIYKIIATIIVQRLRKYMSNLVSPNQSAFISGRLIQYNIIVIHEVLHALRMGRGIGRNNFLANDQLD